MTNKIILVLFLIGLALAGCAHVSPQPPVYTIVSACPPPPEYSRPLLPIRNLTPEALAGLTPEQVNEKVLKAYLVSLAILMSYAEELELLLEGYKITSEPL